MINKPNFSYTYILVCIMLFYSVEYHFIYDNVIIYPHSASTTYKENERITNIFCKNIKLFLKGKPLINQFNSEKGY